jgi:hypothetical protein
MPPRDPFGANTALASQRKVQASRDFAQQIEEYIPNPGTSQEMKQIATILQNAKQRHEDNLERDAEKRKNREEKFAVLDRMEEEEKNNNSLFNKLARSVRSVSSVKNVFGSRNTTTKVGGGSQSKEILGKQRRIYKVAGSRKEHIKYKGQLIPVSDYKKLMKPKH